MFLAQIDPTAAAQGLGRDFLPWAVVGLVCALVAVCRVAWSLNNTIHANAKAAAESLAKLQAEAAAALLKAQSDRSDREREHSKELRDVIMQVVPLSTKMAEGLELLERLTDRGPRHA